MAKFITDLSENEIAVAKEKLLKGVVSRASTLSFIYAIAFSIYSVTSLEFLRLYDPDLTFFDNAWPRLIFNVLPLLGFGFYFRKYEENFNFKAWLWIIGFPLIFLAACLIHVWPLIWQGHSDLYFYVHSANVFIIATTLIAVAPPPKLIVVQTVAFLVFVILPLSVMFLNYHSTHMLKFELGDMVIVIPTSMYVALVVHRLRLKITLLDMEMKRAAAPFLGPAVTDAIYNHNSDRLRNRVVNAVVVQIDVRNFTQFYKSTDLGTVRQVMSLYHSMVSRAVGQNGGYLHKSIGDGHLMTFGAMDAHVDLSDIPGIGEELKTAQMRRTKNHVERAIKTVEAIVEFFEQLKEKYDLNETVGLGIGLASGEVEIRVQGDELYKKELDIDGSAVIRCVRLEEYSKVIRNKVAPEQSVLVVAPDVSDSIELDIRFKRWSTQDTQQIRNFPEIEHVYFRAFPKAKKPLRSVA